MLIHCLPANRMTLKSKLMSLCEKINIIRAIIFISKLQVWNFFGLVLVHRLVQKSKFPNPKGCCGISKICTLPPIKAAYAFFRLSTVKKVLLDGLNIYEQSKFAWLFFAHVLELKMRLTSQGFRKMVSVTKGGQWTHGTNTLHRSVTIFVGIFKHICPSKSNFSWVL